MPSPACAEGLDIESYAFRARVSEQTVLGRDAPEEFEEYDVSASIDMDWHFFSLDWRLMGSAGLLRSSGKNALALSVIPEILFATADKRFMLDIGAGGALFSKYRFGSQDYGGPFQFALTLGLRIPLYKKLGVGYRFMHYSDAGINGPDTIGADFHMIEFVYRL
ncbi:MAG TPA: acyloxyacyl hydrolase [Pseudomonadales bacterium]